MVALEIVPVVVVEVLVGSVEVVVVPVAVVVMLHRTFPRLCLRLR